MKKRKLNLWLNIICITLCIGAIAFGVYSAQNVQLTIGGTIGFYAYADAYVECKIEGGRLKDGEYTGEAYYLTEENSISTTQQSIGLSKRTPTIDFSDITFAKDPTTKVILPLKFTFTITTDSPFTIVTDLNIDIVIFNNVTYTWDTDAVQIIRPEDSAAVEDDSVVKTGTISITMSVIDNQTTTDAIQGNMQLTVKPATTTATDEGFVMNGNTLQAVPSTGENTITIPLYVYDGTNYTKVKILKTGHPTATANEDVAITNISEYYNIELENGIVDIASRAFKNCSNLKNITIPSSVTSVGVCVFQSSGLTKISFPTGSAVNEILAGAFDYCRDLSGVVTIPAGVKTISNYAFQNCNKITGLVFKSDNVLQTIGEKAF